MIILVFETAYNITESVFLMENVSHMCRNICYKVYLLNKKLDETLYESTNDKKSNEKCEMSTQLWLE